MGGAHRELVVWQTAMDLVVACYQVTKEFPASERYGLTSQLQRAAVSVPSNIAEGKARDTRADYARFLRIALGSLRELETHLEIAGRVGLTSQEKAETLLDQCDEVARLLWRLADRIGGT